MKILPLLPIHRPTPQLVSLPRWLAVVMLCGGTLAAAQESVPVITSRGPHSRIWEQQTVRNLPGGRSLTNRSSFVELETGLHVLKDGQWTESREDIELFQGGAIARNGPHQVIWSPNANSAGAIDLLMPDGQRLRSHVLGLGIYDSATGQSELEPRSDWREDWAEFVQLRFERTCCALRSAGIGSLLAWLSRYC